MKKDTASQHTWTDDDYPSPFPSCSKRLAEDIGKATILVTLSVTVLRWVRRK